MEYAEGRRQMSRLTQKSGLTRKEEWCVTVVVVCLAAMPLTFIIWGLAEGCAALNRWDPSVGLGWWALGVIAGLMAWGCVWVCAWVNRQEWEEEGDTEVPRHDKEVGNE